MTFNTATKTAKVCNVKPWGHRLLIEPVLESETTDGGIVIPENARRRERKGTVLAVGPGRRGQNGERQPIGIGIGATVLFNGYAGKYAGTEIVLDGRKCLLVEEDDIVGVEEA